MRVLGYRAFPLSATIGAVVNILILYLLLPKKIGALDHRPLMKYAALMTVASVLSGAAAALLFHGLTKIAGVSFLAKLSGVILCGGTGWLLFYGFCLILGVTEVRSYTKRFLKFR